MINTGLSFADRMCGSKVAFREADAEARAAELGMRVYQCPECQMFHLTARHVVWNRAAKASRRKAQQRARAQKRKSR